MTTRMAAHLSPNRASPNPPPQDGQTPYTYQPLPEGEWFRLLRVHPGAQEDRLHCELIQSPLEDAPPYQALSYVWGNMVMDSEITCSNHDMMITSNLLQFLRSIRDPSRSITVWADAICIDQSATVERGHQVDLMGKIYATADEVIVWLGEDDQELAEHAFGSLIDINTAVQTEAEHNFPAVTEKYNDFLRHYTRAFRTVERMITSKQSAKRRDAVRALYNLPWFKRVWVLQEVGLAKVATAIWGSSKINFAQIALFIFFCGNIDEFPQFLGPELAEAILGAPWHALWNVWCTFDIDGWLYETLPLRYMAKWIGSSSNVDFVLVLEASRLFEATNALDHIYAFLGHPKASFGSDQLFSADYSMKVADLNKIVACVLARQSLNFLVQVQHQLDDLTLYDSHPSWVPQWEVHVQGAPDANWEWWDASLRIGNKNGTRFSVFEDRLTVPVLFIGAINLRTDIMTKEDLNASRLKLGEALEMCWNLTEAAEKIHTSKYAGNALGAFATVLSSYYKGNETIEHWVSEFCKLCWVCNSALYADKVSKKYDVPLSVSTKIMQTAETDLQPQFGRHVKYYCRNRRFFTTENGYWGLGAPGLQTGDVCVVIYGADVPFVLRPIPGCHQYKLVGQCYISGVMYGELLEKGQDGADISEWTDITLV